MNFTSDSLSEEDSNSFASKLLEEFGQKSTDKPETSKGFNVSFKILIE